MRWNLKEAAGKTRARPWQRKFPGYSMTFHSQPRLKVAPASVERPKAVLKGALRCGRGRNLKRFIAETFGQNSEAGPIATDSPR